MERGGMRILVAAVLALAVGVSAADVAAGAEPEIVIRDARVSDFPTVVLDVSLPAHLLADDEAVPTFSVAENGQTVEVLSAKPRKNSDPAEVVLVVDTTGSMRGRPITHARSAAERFITELDPRIPVAVLAITSKPRLVASFTTDRDALATAIGDIGADGETALYDTVVEATRLKASAPSAQRTIVLLSDGGDTTSLATLDAAAAQLRGTSSPLYAIAIKSPDFNIQALTLMSRHSGGRITEVADTGELAGRFASLARELSAGWLVSFRSARPSTKDLELDVKAAVGENSASGTTAITNPRYVTTVKLGDNPLVVPAPSRWTYAAALGLAFGAVFVVAFGGLSVAFGRRTTLDQLRFYDELQGVRDGAGTQDSSPNLIASRLVSAVDSVAGRRGFTGMIAEKLDRAAIAMRPAEYIALHLLGVVILGVGAQMVTGDAIIAAAVVVFVTVAPLAYLDHRGTKRSAKFDAQLPDTLSLISTGLRTGWGLQQALGLAVSEGGSPSAEELNRALIEARLGVPLETALRHVAERVGSERFDWVVTAIAIQREIGGNLAEVMDRVADSVRDRESLDRQVAALSAEGRISAIVLTLLPFVVAGGLYLLNRDYLMRLFTVPIGWAMVSMAGIALVVGIIWLRAVARIEY